MGFHHFRPGAKFVFHAEQLGLREFVFQFVHDFRVIHTIVLVGDDGLRLWAVEPVQVGFCGFFRTVGLHIFIDPRHREFRQNIGFRDHHFKALCFILFTAAVTAVALTYLKAVGIFCEKPNKALVFFGFAAVESGSLLFMLLTSADMYYTAVISGVCFLSLFMMFSLAAYEKKKTAAKCADFFFAGISLVLTVMSRPNMALMSVVMVPLYLNVLCRKDIKTKVKLLSVLSFALPVFVGAAFQMWYNYARFSSVFDFGSAYQLTVADVSKYAVTPVLFLPAIYHYFLQLPDFKTEFPFFHLSASVYKGGYKGYIYLTRTMGIFNLPASLGLFGFPCVLTKKTENWKRATFLLGVIMPVAVAFLDMCLGGVNIRYLADIAFIAVLFGTLIIINLYSAVPDNQKALKFTAYIIFTLILYVSAFVGFLTVFENERYSNFSILS